MFWAYWGDRKFCMSEGGTVRLSMRGMQPLHPSCRTAVCKQPAQQPSWQPLRLRALSRWTTALILVFVRSSGTAQRQHHCKVMAARAHLTPAGLFQSDGLLSQEDAFHRALV